MGCAHCADARISEQGQRDAQEALARAAVAKELAKAAQQYRMRRMPQSEPGTQPPSPVGLPSDS